MSVISSGLSYPPAQEPPETRVKFEKQLEKQRVNADALAAQVPGNEERTDSPPPEIHHAAVDIAQISQAFNKKLQFVVDRQTNEVIVKVIDKTTDKVIKVLPPEELQRLHRKLRETIGFLFNEEV